MIFPVSALVRRPVDDRLHPGDLGRDRRVRASFGGWERYRGTHEELTRRLLVRRGLRQRRHQQLERDAVRGPYAIDLLTCYPSKMHGVRSEKEKIERPPRDALIIKTKMRNEGKWGNQKRLYRMLFRVQDRAGEHEDFRFVEKLFSSDHKDINGQIKLKFYDFQMNVCSMNDN